MFQVFLSLFFLFSFLFAHGGLIPPETYVTPLSLYPHMPTVLPANSVVHRSSCMNPFKRPSADPHEAAGERGQVTQVF